MAGAGVWLPLLLSSTARWSVTRGSVSWISAAQTPVRPFAASIAWGFALNSACACGSFSRFRMKSSSEVTAFIVAFSSGSPDASTDPDVRTLRVNLGSERHAAIGAQPDISRPALGGPGHSPTRALGDRPAGTPDPLIPEGGIGGGFPRQRDDHDQRPSIGHFGEVCPERPMEG